MAFWQALVLGLVQGLTEFIPISSTGHLTITGRLMGLIDDSQPQQWTAFIAVIQLGTLFAVIAYFAKDILAISRGFLIAHAARLRGKQPTTEDRRNAFLGWLVILGSIPIAVVGLAFRDVIEGDVTKNLWVISGTLIGLAVLLFVAERVSTRARDLSKLRWSDALMVGLFQCISLIPGSSRSGTTITGGLFAGLTRETAARFSFLLSIPAITAAGLLQLNKALSDVEGSLAMLAVATIAAAISGYLSIAFLLRYLQRHSTHLFIAYRLALGLAILGLLTTGGVTN